MNQKKVFVALSPFKSRRDLTGQAGGIEKKKVFVALSGGVDSSIAAALLKERGFDVVGIHMKMWGPAQDESGEIGKADKDERAEQFYQAERFTKQSDSPASSTYPVCRQQVEDRYDAMRVAAKLDIPFQTWDFTDEYRSAVVEYMIREYAAGRTPNPDVMCNREIKFGLFLRKALAAGADFVATGHYVRLRNTKRCEYTKEGKEALSYIRKKFVFRSPTRLLQAKDSSKDQSYFLWTLTQEQLTHCLFPIGEYTKPEVRELARKFDLPTAGKPDSQGICFIGEINVRDFLKTYIPERRGRVLTTTGRAVGEHEGTTFYTIGQREGLGIGGGVPYYVAEKDVAANTLVVAEGPYDEKLFRAELTATDINWISGQMPTFPLLCEAQIRYRQPLQRCTVQTGEIGESAFGLGEIETFSPSAAIHPVTTRTPHLSGRGGGENPNISSEAPAFRPGCNGVYQPKRFNNLIVRFDEPQRAVTPGQSIVFYKNREVLGGGIIA